MADQTTIVRVESVLAYRPQELRGASEQTALLALKKALGAAALRADKTYEKLSDIAVVCRGEDVLLRHRKSGEVIESIVSTDDTISKQTQWYKQVKGYKSFDAFSADLKHVYKHLANTGKVTFIYTCFSLGKTKESHSANPGDQAVRRLYDAGLFRIPSFNCLSGFDEKEIKTILKSFSTYLSGWLEIDKEWNKNKKSASESIAKMHPDNTVMDDKTKGKKKKQKDQVFAERWVIEFVKKLRDSMVANDNLKANNFYHSYRRLSRNLPVLRENFANNRIALAGYSPQTIEIVFQYPQSWATGGLLDNEFVKVDGDNDRVVKSKDSIQKSINRRFVRESLEYYDQYLISIDEELVEKPSVALAISDNVVDNLRRMPVLHLGNNYTQFTLTADKSDRMEFRFGPRYSCVIPCKPSKYFSNIQLKMEKDIYSVKFDVFSSINNKKNGKASKTIEAFIKEPEVRIFPYNNSLTAEDVANGRFDIKIRLPYSGVKIDCNHGFTIDELWAGMRTDDGKQIKDSGKKTIRAILSAALPDYSEKTQNLIEDDRHETLLQILGKRKLRIMGVDLGMRPLAGISIADYTYTPKIKYKEVFVGTMNFDLPAPGGDAMMLYSAPRKNGEPGKYLNRPYSEMAEKIDRLAKVVSVGNSLNTHIKMVIESNLGKYKVRSSPETVLSDVRGLDICTGNFSGYAAMFASEKVFNEHIQTLPEDLKIWRRKEYLHPLRPFIAEIHRLIGEIRRYQKTKLFAKYFDMHMIFGEAFDIIRSYWLQGQPSGFHPEYVKAQTRQYRKSLQNLKDNFVQLFASRIAKMAREHKVAIVAMENLDMIRKIDRDNTMVNVWSPGYFKKAIENALAPYGITIIEVSPWLTSQVYHETNEPGFADGKLIYTESGREDRDINAARNIRHLAATRGEGWLHTVKIHLTHDKDKCVVIVPDRGLSKRNRASLTRYFKSENPVLVRGLDGCFVPSKEKFKDIQKDLNGETVKLRRIKNAFYDIEEFNKRMQALRDAYQP